MSKIYKRWLLVICLLIVFVLFVCNTNGFNNIQASGTITPTQVSDDIVNALAKEIYCPICNNVTLDMCETRACMQWKQMIKEKISEGWTKEEIKAYLVEAYGEQVLAEPPLINVFNWLIYFIPLLLFVIGVFTVIRYIKDRMVMEQKE